MRSGSGRGSLGQNSVAVARVAQPSGINRARVDCACEQRLLELRRPREYLAILVEGHAVAVEHQLVLASDLVAEHNGRQVVSGALCEHPLALHPLACVEG